jgi:hypothetical protein
MARSIPVRTYRKRINGKTITVSRHERVLETLNKQGIEIRKKEPSFLTNVSSIKRIDVEPGTIHYLGASSSPDTVYIDWVDKDFIIVRRYPYYTTQKVSRPIADDLIRQGDSTVYNQGSSYVLGRHTFKNYQYLMLGKKVMLDEIQAVDVELIARGQTWDGIEKMGYNVVSSKVSDPEQFTISTTKMGAINLKKMFNVLKVTERH